MLYSSEAAACTSGWTQIQNQVPGLQNATASFSNGTCTLSLNGSMVMTLPVYDNRGQYVTVDSAIASLAIVSAYRDDGHVINFTANDSGFTSEPGVEYRLVSANGGYQLIDDQDNVETYDSAGKLLSVADRAGNVQTLAYGGPGGLLSSVNDNFGHTLTLAYDSQNRLSTVVSRRWWKFRDGVVSKIEFQTNHGVTSAGETTPCETVPWDRRICSGEASGSIRSSNSLDDADLHDGQVPWYLGQDFEGITRGNDIYFRPGVYDSTTPAGIAVLGHELVHVGQYRGGMNWLEYLCSTRHGYANSKYEIPAYAMQSRIEQDLEKVHSQGCPACKK